MDVKLIHIWRSDNPVTFTSVRPDCDRFSRALALPAAIAITTFTFWIDLENRLSFRKARSRSPSLG